LTWFETFKNSTNVENSGVSMLVLTHDYDHENDSQTFHTDTTPTQYTQHTPFQPYSPLLKSKWVLDIDNIGIVSLISLLLLASNQIVDPKQTWNTPKKLHNPEM
jgi:hypothetical protein